jgi:RNA-directed DNA polymerase
MSQKSDQGPSAQTVGVVKPQGPRLRVEASPAGSGDERLGSSDLMERACERQNLRAALKRVRQNAGSPGIDGMTVEELPGYLRVHWPRLREELLAGRYQPQPVRRVAIPKPGGGERELGIPTVLDRFIQQALLQVLQPLFDPTFSDASYGFRPGRSAHDAVRRAQAYVQEGRSFVVDIDLEKFFDRVNHDILMGRLAKRIADRRVLRLIRRYLTAGVLANGVVIEREEGTPQGGPLSPLLANILLDEVDKELERRGHAFVRYADDLNVYVRTQRSGERVMTSLRKLFEKLKLRVNETKSKVTRATASKFLGFSFWIAPGRTIRRRVAPQAIARMKQRVRELTRRSAGAKPRATVQTARNVLVGLESLLPARGHATGVRRHRWLGSSPSPGGATQALEARPGHLSRVGRSRDASRSSQTGCRQQHALVAQLGDGAQHGAAERPLQTTGSPQTCQLTSTHRTARCGPACRVVWQGTRSTSAPLCRLPVIFVVANLVNVALVH